MKGCSSPRATASPALAGPSASPPTKRCPRSAASAVGRIHAGVVPGQAHEDGPHWHTGTNASRSARRPSQSTSPDRTGLWCAWPQRRPGHSSAHSRGADQCRMTPHGLRPARRLAHGHVGVSSASDMAAGGGVGPPKNLASPSAEFTHRLGIPYCLRVGKGSCSHGGDASLSREVAKVRYRYNVPALTERAR